MATLTKTPTEMARHDMANGNWRNCGSASSSTAYSGVGSSTSDGKTYYRCLVNFDISAIPSTATISSATLKLYITGGTAASTQGSYRTKLINQSWTSAKPSWGGGATSGNTTSGYLDSTNGTYNTITGAGFYTFNVTTLLQKWVAAKSSYHGIAIISHTESTDSSTGCVMDGVNSFASMKYIANVLYSGGSSYYPLLTVTYTTTKPVVFNGNEVSTIKFNGNTVTSLVYNGTKIF